jgi:starvation-inducible DNA-binding protein
MSPLSKELHALLSDVYTFQFRAHAYHWNVKGKDFYQYHEFFGEVYEDVASSVDHLAEQIRTLLCDAPMSLLEICQCTRIPDERVSSDPMDMTASLYRANTIVLENLNKAFSLANSVNKQGIADLLASRIDAHEKWGWQLRTTLNLDERGGVLPGKSEAEPRLMESIYINSAESQYDEYDQILDDVITAAAPRKAPKKDRIYGSKTNKPGSAKAKNAKTIKFSDRTETALRNKVEEHNKKAQPGRRATMNQLKAVYRRGAGAYSSSHRPGKTRDQWAMARVNAYLHLLRTGRPENKNYTQDNDILPATHPKSSKGEAAILASANALRDALTVVILEESEYNSTEEAIVAMAEYSGAGYEIIPALRSAWKRGVVENESGFDRAFELATQLHASKDNDLLPLRTRGSNCD